MCIKNDISFLCVKNRQGRNIKSELKKKRFRSISKYVPFLSLISIGFSFVHEILINIGVYKECTQTLFNILHYVHQQ